MSDKNKSENSRENSTYRTYSRELAIHRESFNVQFFQKID